MPRSNAIPELVVIVAGVVAALHVGKLPPALPVLRDAFAITLLEAGFLLSLVQLAGMTTGLLVGLAADGVGLRRSVLTGLAILALASALGGFARDAHQLMWLRGLEGFGFLFVVLPVPSLLRSLVSPERLSLRLGLWGAFMPAGTALALLCGPWVMSVAGWQGWWWSLAALTAAMMLWTARSVPADRARVAAGARPDPAGGESWMQRLRLTLSSAGPWLVALTFAMYSSQWMAVIGFLPSIYAQAGYSVRAAGALTALVAAVNIIGNVGSGRLLHRGVRPEIVLYVGFVAMIAGAVGAFGLPDTSSAALRYGAVLLLSAFGGLIPGALFSLAVQLAPGVRTVSTTVGWMQQFSALGQFVGPPLVAWVASVTGGWQWTWTVTGSASLAGLLLAAIIGRVHRR
ncbi:MAG: MFS transporter [Burkholderiales bacterium]|nr:MFS transporter [Burkholderiales bacterium]